MEVVVIKVGIALIITVVAVGAGARLLGRFVGPLLEHPYAQLAILAVGALIFVALLGAFF